MGYVIKDLRTLRNLLWTDAFLGGSTALIGFVFFAPLTSLLGLPLPFIVLVSGVTLLYALVACRLVSQSTISITLLRGLVAANWGWTFISSILLLVHYHRAARLGLAFLILQLLVVGALAYLEGRQIVKK